MHLLMWWWFLAVFIPLCSSLVSCCYNYTLPTPQVLPVFKVWICLPKCFPQCLLHLRFRSSLVSVRQPLSPLLLIGQCLSVGLGLRVSAQFSLRLSEAGIMSPGLGVRVYAWFSKFLLPQQLWAWHSRRIRFGFYSVVFPELLLDLLAP